MTVDAAEPAPSPAPSPSPKRQGMLAGVAWMMAFRLFDRGAGVLSILVLARLLLPEHFGVVALASSVVAFIELLAALGLDTILIQRKDLTRAHYDTAWTIQCGIAALCALCLCAAAHPASLFFREPRLEPIAYALALGLFLDGLVNIRVVDFRKNMRFDLEFRFMATRRVVAVVVTMISAFLLRNEWALAIGIVSSRATGVLMSYLMSPYLPRPTLAMRHELLANATWLFLSNVVLFARQRSAEIVLGRVAGAGSVGTFLLASDLANTLSQELVSPINRVALPDMADKGSKEGIARRFDLLTGQLAILLTPLCIGLAACAPVVIALMFGPQWAASVDVLRILAVAGCIAGLASNIGVAFLSLGMYRANAWIHAAGAAILLPMLIGGAATHGAVGAALAVLVANTLTVLLSLVIGQRAMGYGPWAFTRRLARPAIAAGVMYAAIQAFDVQWAASWPLLGRLGAEVALGALVYPAVLLTLFALVRGEDAAERKTFELLAHLRDRIRRR